MLLFKNKQILCFCKFESFFFQNIGMYTKFAQNEVQKEREGREPLGAVGLASQRAGSKPLVIIVGYFTE
jgi:hypothetical protein